MKLFIAKSGDDTILYFGNECPHVKKIIRFSTNDVLVACKKEKTPVAFYLKNMSVEKALDVISYLVDKSFLYQIAENDYLSNFFKAFSDIDEIVFI